MKVVSQDHFIQRSEIEEQVREGKKIQSTTQGNACHETKINILPLGTLRAFSTTHEKIHCYATKLIHKHR